MVEQDSKSPNKSNSTTFEGNLFGVLFVFHKKAMDLLRNAGPEDDKLKLVSERLTQLLADVTAEAERTRNWDLARPLELAYEEVKHMVDELSGSAPGR